MKTKRKPQSYIPLYPTQFYLVALFILVSLVLIKWWSHLSQESIYFVLGAIVGLHLFDILESFILDTAQMSDVTASPLRNIVVQWGLLVLTLFVLSSTTSFLGKGVVLFLNLRLVWLQWQLARQQRLQSWFSVAHIAINHTGCNKYVWLLLMFVVGQYIVFLFL